VARGARPQRSAGDKTIPTFAVLTSSDQGADGKREDIGGDAVVEARIAAADIDRVHAGQPVTVNVKAAGFSRYGALKGTLKEISSSPFGDGDAEPYYKGIIALERGFVGRGENKKRLMPGMAVEARVWTGSTTLLGFLLGSIIGG